MHPLVSPWAERGAVAEHAGYRVWTMDTARDAPTLLFIHGFPASSWDLAPAAALLDDGFRIVTLDLPGYGLSDRPFDAEYTIARYADVVESLIATHGLTDFGIVAHDMGDTVTAELLARGLAPRGVVLLNGSIYIDMAQLSPGQEFLLALDGVILDEDLPTEGFRPGLRETFNVQPSDDELDAMFWLLSREGGTRLLPKLILYIEDRRRNQARYTAGLVDYAGPLKCVWGERDPIAVAAMPDRLASERPGTEVVKLANVGHWPAMEAPGRVAEEIRRSFD